MSISNERRRVIDELTKKLTDQGKIIEGGWASFEYLVLQGAPDAQRRQMRKAFFLGAQHLFSSIMSVLDPGSEEPTDQDMDRMGLIAKELAAFEMEVTAVHEPGHS